MSGPTLFSLNLTGITARGCNNLLSSKRLFLKRRECLTNFIPPPVEPAHPPIKSRTKKIILENAAQCRNQKNRYPVVVTSEVT